MRKKGFTLIELMLVVIIIGVLAAMVIPKMSNRSEQARVAVCKADIQANIALALDMFEMDNGSYPDGLDGLLDKNEGKGPYLKKEARDPWGRPYKYERLDEGAGYRLCSDGQDELNLEDDICND